MSKSKRYSIVVPTVYNDGSVVGEDVVSGIMVHMTYEFGGCTTSATHRGQWAQGGRLYDEPGIIVWAIGDDELDEYCRDADTAGWSKLLAVARYVKATLRQETVLVYVEEVDAKFV